jgi:sigma-B regulation protein RsbU (phosphoserine phosphatase)
MNAAAEVRILIVEDDPILQHIFRKLLEMNGYRVEVVGDGREGMKAIVSFEPHVVLSDWMMPEMDGLEMCQAVKTGLGEDAPYFIIISARGEAADRNRAFEGGVDDYIVKPCDHGEVLQRVQVGLRLGSRVARVRSLEEELRVTRLELAALRRELERRDDGSDEAAAA